MLLIELNLTTMCHIVHLQSNIIEKQHINCR